MVISIPYKGEQERETSFWWWSLLAHGAVQHKVILWFTATQFQDMPQHEVQLVHFLSETYANTFQYSSNGELLEEKSQFIEASEIQSMCQKKKKAAAKYLLMEAICAF